jgi:gluconokinase
MVNTTYPAIRLLYLKGKGLGFSGAFVSSESSYMFYRLTGKRWASDCTGSGSGLLNTHTRQWDPDVLGEIGFTTDQIGRVVTYRDIVPLSTEGAALLGLRPGIPVVPAHPDGALNQVGSGALVEGKMTFSVGTSGALRLSAAGPVLPESMSTWCYMAPDAWMSGAATNGACNCVDWAKPLLFPGKSYREVEAEPPDYRNLPFFLPFLWGERCPGWNDEREGGFGGLRPEHTALDMYFSVLEGVLFNLYQCYRELQAVAGTPREIKLSGGILKSRAWQQMAADIFGEEMHCESIPNASMLGAAVLGLFALGRISSLRDWETGGGEVLRPDREKHRIFQERFRTWEEYYRGEGKKQ